MHVVQTRENLSTSAPQDARLDVRSTPPHVIFSQPDVISSVIKTTISTLSKLHATQAWHRLIIGQWRSVRRIWISDKSLTMSLEDKWSMRA